MNDEIDAYRYSVLGHQLSLPQIAQSMRVTLEDDESAENDPSACNHRVALPYQDRYACGTCHKEVTLDEVREVWLNLNNGVVKISGIRMVRENDPYMATFYDPEDDGN